MPVLSFLGEYGSEARNASITLNSMAIHGPRRGGDGVRIEFSTPIPKDASGYIVIQPDSFERLAFAMMAIKEDAAIKAFGAALHADTADVLKAFGVRLITKEEAAAS
jgi:hypothetical protein